MKRWRLGRTRRQKSITDNKKLEEWIRNTTTARNNKENKGSDNTKEIK